MTPDTPLNHDGNHAIIIGSSPKGLKVRKDQLTISPDTPLNHDGDGVTTAGSSRSQPSATASAFRRRRSQTPIGLTRDIDHKLFLDFSGQHSVRQMTQSMMNPPKALHDDSGTSALRVTNANASPFDFARTGYDQHIAAQRSRVDRGEVQRPQLVTDKVFELASHQANVKGDATPLDGGLLSAVPTRDPPLYDNIQDKLRQMAVDLWLLRSRLAYSIEDWKAMEHHGQQAYDLADDLQWEPFVAKCAFPIGIARFKQRDWLGAYENFEEAERTEGYYISRSEILRWLKLANSKLDRSAAPSLYGMSVEPGEQAPFITPLGSVVEEEEDFPFPTTAEQKPPSENSPTSQYSTGEPENLTEAAGTSISSEATQRHSPSGSVEKPKQVVVTGVNGAFPRAPSLARSITSRQTDNIAGVSPTDRVLRLPSRPARIPAAITLASNPAPASIGSHRLYDPGPHPAPSPPLPPNTPPLRTALYMPRSYAASSLSEMELPSPQFAQDSGHKHGSSQPDRGASWSTKSEQDDRKPLNPSSLSARKTRTSPGLDGLAEIVGDANENPLNLRSPGSAPLDGEDLDLISALSSLPASPSGLTMNKLAALSANTENGSPMERPHKSASEASLPQNLPSPLATIDMSHPNLSTQIHTEPAQSPTSTLPDPLPESSQALTIAPPTQTTTPLSASGRRQQALEDARIEDEIAKIKATASPRVRSARSAGVFSSPRASVLHSPPHPGRYTNHGRPGAGQSIHAARPKSKRAISDGEMFRAQRTSSRPRSWSSLAGAHPLSQGSSPLAERKRAVLASPARLGRRIRWGDGWMRQQVAALNESKERVVPNGSGSEDVGESESEGESERGEASGEGNDNGSQKSGDRSSEEGGVKVDEDGGQRRGWLRGWFG